MEQRKKNKKAEELQDDREKLRCVNATDAWNERVLKWSETLSCCSNRMFSSSSRLQRHYITNTSLSKGLLECTRCMPSPILSAYLSVSLFLTAVCFSLYVSMHLFVCMSVYTYLLVHSSCIGCVTHLRSHQRNINKNWIHSTTAMCICPTIIYNKTNAVNADLPINDTEPTCDNIIRRRIATHFIIHTICLILPL